MPKSLHRKKKKKKILFCLVNLLLLKFATSMVIDCPLTMAGARHICLSKKATSPTKDMRLLPALFILTIDKRSVAEVATLGSLIHSDGLPTPFDKGAVAEVVAWRSWGRILRTAGLPLNLQQLERGR